MSSAYITGTLARRSALDGGFTLVELVAVMIVIAILAAAVVPALESVDDGRAAIAARSVHRDLVHARQHAVATGTATWVVFDPDAETWSLLAEDPSTPGRANAATMTDFATGHSFVQVLGTDDLVNAELVSVAFDGDVEVGFDWLGQPLNAAETALAADGTVVTSGGHSITVVFGTGHIIHTEP